MTGVGAGQFSRPVAAAAGAGVGLAASRERAAQQRRQRCVQGCTAWRVGAGDGVHRQRVGEMAWALSDVAADHIRRKTHGCDWAT
jgi:uncharacterized protein YfiM (DUF2279 family)